MRLFGAPSFRSSILKQVSAAVALCLLIFALNAIYRHGVQVKHQIDALSYANADSQQWSLVQLDVEFGQMERALLRLDPQQPDTIDAFLKRFDIFYSRVAIVGEGQSFQPIFVDAGAREDLKNVQAFLAQTANLIDENRADLPRERSNLLAQMGSLEQDVRAMTLMGLKVFSDQVKLQREQVFHSLVKLALLTAALILAISAGLVALWFLWRFGSRAAQSLGRAKNRLEAMIGTSLDAVIVTDDTLHITEFNGAAEKIFGYARDEAIGLQLSRLITPDPDDSTNPYPFGQGLVKLLAKRDDGTVFPAELSIAATEISAARSYVTFLRDISAREAARRELIAARDTAMAGERAKAHFVAVMSHELRTPLNGLLGTLELIRDTDLDARQARYIEAMDQSGQILLHHVNDVLDVERLDAGKLKFENVAYAPTDIVHKIFVAQENAATAQRNKLELEVVGPEIGLLMGDPTRVRQLMVNLIGNAIKFTKDGLVRVELQHDRVQNSLEIRVIDTGIGIARDDLNRIFDDFFAANATVSDEIAGTGLGLGIVRRLIEAMGGTYGAESELGEGSVFWVTLPAKPARKLQGAASSVVQLRQPPKDIPSHDILVVEDNPLNRVVMREMLIRAGHSVWEAKDGQAGVDMAQERVYDVILMDLNMPVMNGLEATRHIRGNPGANQYTKIIAVTANVLPEAVENLLQAGCDKVISKPITRAALSTVFDGTRMPGSTAPDPNTVQLLDSAVRADLQSTFGEKAFSELQQDFLTEGRMRLALLRQLVDAEDMTQYAQLAHRFAGSSAIIGICGLHRILKQHETLATEGKTEKIREGLEQLAAIWADTEKVLSLKAG
ncbi:hypothetical protein BFP70_18065 [Thioclava sp. SK-1]|uniref:hybrid sensor histidine kinase/response regulator n=1 Tax=Thioclava sp. SK-1 TaxID=1889770 RepID=UPI000826621A|nr:ATP-binding protein [Thioclava sp. SK-1]OCX60004.1 hypothetical protein BFP70_18065 [Thioclava sp. SK-1]